MTSISTFIIIIIRGLSVTYVAIPVSARQVCPVPDARPRLNGHRSASTQGRKPGTKCGGTSCAGGLGDRSPPVGSRGEAPVLGDEVPQKLKQFLISICIILTEF